jgi:hypothetical protein
MAEKRRVRNECSRCGQKTDGFGRFCPKCSPTDGDPRLPCGTRAASARHRSKGEPLDEDCLAAERAHHAKYSRARSRAKDRLAREFPDRLKELYRDEVRKLGGHP